MTLREVKEDETETLHNYINVDQNKDRCTGILSMLTLPSLLQHLMAACCQVAEKPSIVMSERTGKTEYPSLVSPSASPQTLLKCCLVLYSFINEASCLPDMMLPTQQESSLNSAFLCSWKRVEEGGEWWCSMLSCLRESLQLQRNSPFSPAFYYPRSVQKATIKTKLFLWGCWTTKVTQGFLES